MQATGKQSIQAQNRLLRRLPDFRNLGVCLRILIIVNLIALLAAIYDSKQVSGIFLTLAQQSTFIQPILLTSLCLLYAAYPLLAKLPYKLALIYIGILELIVTYVTYKFGDDFLGFEPVTPIANACIINLIICGILVYYFNLRQRALSPAIAEARLQALQARIRPHFLFNSINAVLSLLRSNPKRAETALEDMADLFRVLMADNRDLVPLAQEIALCRQYLALEKLRLEERLQITWQIDNMPPDAMIPPLVLQPLVENAVYHGIEPLPEGGNIQIKIYTNRDEIHLVLTNPYANHTGQHSGNKMALTNIRERLALHFDAEASLTSTSYQQQYVVHIVLPYHRQHG